MRAPGRILHGFCAASSSYPENTPPNVAVFLTDGMSRFTLPDGKTVDAPIRAGTTQWDPGGQHLPENVGDKPFELIVVELKTKAEAAK